MGDKSAQTENDCEIIAECLTIPFVDGGRDINVGVDCYGLSAHVFSRLHNNKNRLPIFRGIKGADKVAMTSAMLSLFSPDELSRTPKRGDLAVLFSGTTLIHVGLVVLNECGLRVLHTSKRWGVVVDTISNFERKIVNSGYYTHA